MSPIYESAADRANEEDIVRTVCERMGWDWKHCKKLRQLDPRGWEIRHNDGVTVRGYLMAMKRNWSHGRGDGYWVSYTKVTASDNARATSGKGARLAVRFSDKPDEIWWTQLCGPYRTTFNGRDDRPNDPKAKEVLAVIEWSDFELVKPPPSSRP